MITRSSTTRSSRACPPSCILTASCSLLRRLPSRAPRHDHLRGGPAATVAAPNKREARERMGTLIDPYARTVQQEKDFVAEPVYVRNPQTGIVFKLFHIYTTKRCNAQS